MFNRDAFRRAHRPGTSRRRRCAAIQKSISFTLSMLDNPLYFRFPRSAAPCAHCGRHARVAPQVGRKHKAHNQKSHRPHTSVSAAPRPCSIACFCLDAPRTQNRRACMRPRAWGGACARGSADGQHVNISALARWNFESMCGLVVTWPNSKKSCAAPRGPRATPPLERSHKGLGGR